MGDPDLTAPRPILLNARAATRPTITGVERWTAEVVVRLRGLDPVRYRVVAPRTRVAASRGPAQAWEQAVLPVLAARARAGALFSPANLAPIAWERNVLVMHDAAVLREPAAYSAAYRAWHGRAGLWCARRAVRVITVSEFSRRELVDVAGLDPERVAVVPGGVGESFTPAADAARAATRLRLRRPYVLTIATADARKNLEALGPVARRLDALGMDLVWAGDDRPYFARTGGAAGLRAVGYVDDVDLPGLYAGAQAFVLPSRYEGFGLTCLEAMACGVPVVAADRAALPETCGDAALLVDPDDPRALSEAVARAASDEEVRAGLRERGLRRAAGFTWDRTACQVDVILRAVAGDPRPSTGREAPEGALISSA